ncbi:MAG: translation initiation factor IF-2 [Christensenellales bacterium]|jgi:translation initiation factor IF-2
MAKANDIMKIARETNNQSLGLLERIKRSQEDVNDKVVSLRKSEAEYARAVDNMRRKQAAEERARLEAERKEAERKEAELKAAAEAQKLQELKPVEPDTIAGKEEASAAVQTGGSTPEPPVEKVEATKAKAASGDQTPRAEKTKPESKAAETQNTPQPRRDAAPGHYANRKPARPAADRGREVRPAASRPARPADHARPAGQSGAGAPVKPRKPAERTTPAPAAAGKERVSNYDPNRSGYARNYEAEKKAKSRRTLMKENMAASGGLDDDRRYRRKPKRPAAPKKMHIEPIKIEHAVVTGDSVMIKELAEKIGRPAAEIIKKLLLVLGTFATINQEIDFDTASLIAADFGVTLEQRFEKTYEEALIEEDTKDAPEDLSERPPVVTIMGHVDHGKTSLLDSIRHTRVTAGEAGGITQHIGAYMIDVNGKPITFLDTPGHEAFTSMRARGAQVTDIAILVVAADDGIMPQTVEAISHAKAAGVPIVVAINKIDKESANVDRVMQALTEHELLPEEWGGDTIVVPVSAHTQEGVQKLLEMVLLLAEMQELKANPNRHAKGTIIETQLDKGRGPVATVLVQNGTLRVGDTVVAGMTYGRVRALMNDRGERVQQAGPSEPVEMLGLSDVPMAGDMLNVVQEDKLSRQVADERRDKLKAEQNKGLSRVSLDDLFSRIEQGEVKDLNIIIKCDVQGSMEALRSALLKLSNDEVRVNVIHAGVGAISESDVMLAATANAIIIGFNIRPDTKARATAEAEKIDVRLYTVIYSAIEDVQTAMKGMLAPVFEEKIIGQVDVRTIFKASGIGTIAGCYVTDGKVLRNAHIRLYRDDVMIHDGKIASLKRFKNDAREVASGYECGISLENFHDIKEGDKFEVYINEQVDPS